MSQTRARRERRRQARELAADMQDAQALNEAFDILYLCNNEIDAYLKRDCLASCLVMDALDYLVNPRVFKESRYDQTRGFTERFAESFFNASDAEVALC